MTNETIIAEIEKTIDGSLSQELADIIKDALDKARAEGENFILNTMQEHIKEGKYEHYDCFLCTIVRKIKHDEEAGRQSAQKEKEAAVLHIQEECRKEMQFKIIEAETKILNAAHIIEQERVRTLKELLEKQYEWNDYQVQTIDNIFPDCAEQKEK